MKHTKIEGGTIDWSIARNIFANLSNTKIDNKFIGQLLVAITICQRKLVRN